MFLSPVRGSVWLATTFRVWLQQVVQSGLRDFPAFPLDPSDPFLHKTLSVFDRQKEFINQGEKVSAAYKWRARSIYFLHGWRCGIQYTDTANGNTCTLNVPSPPGPKHTDNVNIVRQRLKHTSCLGDIRGLQSIAPCTMSLLNLILTELDVPHLMASAT